MKLIWQLLRQHVSVLQLAGFLVTNLVGVAIVLTAVQLYRDVTPALQAPDSFLDNDFIILNLFQNLLRTVDYLFRNTCKCRNFNTVTVVRAASDDFTQKRNIVTAFLNGNSVIFNTVKFFLKFGKLVIMSCKKRLCADFVLILYVLNNRPSYRQSVKCACTASDFIKNNK